MKKRRKVWTKKRPIAVTIVALGIVALFLIRLYQVIQPLVQHKVFKNGIDGPLTEGITFTPLGLTILSSGAYLLLSLAGIVILIGFLRLRRWSWVVLMAWTGISLTAALINYFNHEPNYLLLASNTIIAFALTQADVQRIFKIRMDEGEHFD